MENISFQYPTWYILLCLLLGLAYATFLYFRDKSFKEKSSLVSGALGMIRFLTVSLLSILLLTPLLKSLTTEIKKPVVVIAQDQSESIIADMDEAELAQYKESINQLSAKLGEEYDLKQYAFGADVREEIDFKFEDKVSNVSELLSDLYDMYSSQNLGAVILATDGIYNEGSNPIYASTKLAAPIYTVALGDTTPQKDLILKRVFHNKIAYLGDKFSVQVDVVAQNCAGSNTSLNIYQVSGNKTNRLKQIPININKNDFFTTKEIILDANSNGVQRYRVTVAKVADEVNALNNSKDIFVDVLDARQKILLIANAPHPDLSAIKQALSSNKNYEIETAYIYDQNINLADVDFVVLHQLPSRTHAAVGLLKKLNDNKTPRLYVLGAQSDFAKMSKAQSLIKVQSSGNQVNDVQAKVAPNFSLFTIDESLKNELPKFAPLLSPFGDFKESGNAAVLLYQRIGKIDTKYPLLLFGEESDTKTAVLCAEGIWKWRLFDYLQHKNHDVFNELIGKTVQYLSLKEDKRKFRVSVSKNIFDENEPIIFDAELYNESYELVNDPDVTLTIKSSDGKDFNFTFNKTTNAYTLNARYFPVGNYTFRSTVMSNGKQLDYNGQFSVQPVQLELYETTADHNILKLLSEKYGGALVYPGEVATLSQLIKDKGTVKPIYYETSKTRSIINSKWIFFLLLGLLTLEWFFRRYFGAY